MSGAKNFTLDTAARLVLFFFFAPFFVYALTSVRFGDMAYRALDVAHAGALAVVAYLLARRDNLRLSGVAKAFALLLVVDMAAVLIASFVEYRPEVVPAVYIQTTLLFVTIFLSFDIFARKYSFEEFCELASPVAIALIVVSAYHVQFVSPRVWGRAFYFGLHPNLGGEVLFGALVVAAFNKRASLRWMAYALGMWALFLIQSRAAELGALALIAGAEIPRTNKGLGYASVGAIAALAVICVGLLLNPSLTDGLVHFVKEDMMKTSDPYRGEGTGLVGRADTWIMALDKLAAHPLFGTGINQSGTTAMGIGIHNGYLKMMAELGIMGALVDVWIIVTLGIALMKDWRRGVAIGACAVLFFFNNRSLNLMVFPLLMWVSLLPWAPPRSARARTGEAALGDRWSFTPRGASAPTPR
ncbi:MAG TPA: O-antigen ligase family protein [Caulobacterales bacterium]|jgi:O-antigen ligase|nr:O-antigen ligase family protein [Caulobacterales bacterium]